MQVAEIITFEVKTGVSHDDVVEVNKSALQAIEKLEGFLYRSLSFDKASNTWTDIIYWKDAACSKNAGEQFMQSDACQKLMAIVEKESTNMKLTDILYSSSCSEIENCG